MSRDEHDAPQASGPQASGPQAFQIIGDLAKVNIGPGDMLVLQMAHEVRAETFDRIRAYFEKALSGVFQGKVPIVILGPDMELRVMRDAFADPDPDSANREG